MYPTHVVLFVYVTTVVKKMFCRPRSLQCVSKQVMTSKVVSLSYKKKAIVGVMFLIRLMAKCIFMIFIVLVSHLIPGIR